jgi:hypothetical protein
MDSFQDDVVAEFCAITGATEAEALQFLEVTGGCMEDAVNLFCDTGARGEHPNPALSSHHVHDDEELARRLHSEQEEEVCFGFSL